MKTIEFFAMGCHMNATLFSNSPAAVNKLRQTPQWFEEWEQILSRFRQDSELSIYNAKNGQVDSMSLVFREVLTTAMRMEELSEGLITPRIRREMEKIGYQNSFDLIKSKSEQVVGVTDKHFGIKELVPEEENLDFGGVAKGWAAHQAMNRLSKYAPALVNAGGDIAISGLMPNREGWIINIINPFDQKYNIAELRVGKAGVATSGIDYRTWMQGEIRRHHIIDPRTGVSAETDLMCVTVVAPNVIEAEMAAKKVMILGSDEGLAWLTEQNNYAAFLILQNQKIRLTPSMGTYLRSKLW